MMLHVEVFPMLVGVFPIKPISYASGYRLPHARGGVSHDPFQYSYYT